MNIPELSPFGRTQKYKIYEDEGIAVVSGTLGEGFVIEKEEATREQINEGRVLENLVFIGEGL